MDSRRAGWRGIHAEALGYLPEGASPDAPRATNSF